MSVAGFCKNPRLSIYAEVKWASLRFPEMNNSNHTISWCNKLFSADWPTFNPVIQTCMRETEDFREIERALEIQYKYGGYPCA